MYSNKNTGNSTKDSQNDIALSKPPERLSIVVKHFPPEVSEQTAKELFEEFGNGKTVDIKHWKSRNMVFVRYDNSESAARAMSSLNKKKVLDKVLIVEWAKDEQEKLEDQWRKTTLSNKEPEPIAPSLGIFYGPPPNLEYSYPPPNEQILKNIHNAIASVPKLYIQVLHLMNKMNLPPPFGSLLPISSEFTRKRKGYESDEEEEESPIVNDNEESYRKLQETTRRKPTVIEHAAKVAKTSIQLKVPQNFVPSSQNENVQVTEMEVQESASAEPLPMPTRNVISLHELQTNRMTQQEIDELPLFKDKGKNHDPGQPSLKLFVSNMDRTVKKSDLEFIFGRYFDSDEAARAGIKEMTGKMKGQAFITFPSVEIAKKALTEVHGYLLHDKPMIIAFGRQK